MTRALSCACLALVTLLVGCSGTVGDDDTSALGLPRAGAGGTAGSSASSGASGGGSGGAAGSAGSTALAGSAGSAGAGLNCGAGLSACGTACVDRMLDEAHCGACGNACGAGSSCQAGVCTVPCASGQAVCDGVCKTIVSDPANCGTCGTACASGQFCSAGRCVAECPFQACESAGATECADLATNPSHCGACGEPCGAGLSCLAGVCTLSCASGLSACSGQCVDRQTSASNCGACGTQCPTGTPCTAGQCGCPSGQTPCQGACVDLTNSAGNCGACGTACTSGQACEASQCRAGCSSGLTACDGSCANTQTDASHCGSCERACAASQTCVAGSCACPNGGSLCDSTCADLQIDEAHCGACATACASTQVCTAGTCMCPSGLTLCDGACVDTDTSGAHCGACGESCEGGSSCNGGSCTCPNALTKCGDACVDTDASDAHCGACDAACGVGQACLVGVCTGAGGVGQDGCAGGLARNLTLSRIDAFQTVRVTIMNNGSEVAANARNTDVVQGRETLFRVFVTPGSGWTARELSARLTVVNGAGSNEYFTKKSVSQASTEADTQSTFQITVPADQVQADSRYHVELVECATPPSGSATAPRFPAAEEIALAARRSGALKVRVIPIRANNRVPDTSETALAPYKALLDAMYPTTSIELSVGTELSANYPVDWNGTLDRVRSKRQSDSPAPAADVYYYGLIAPTATFNEFCNGGCTAGIGFVTQANDSSRRVAMGIGFSGNQSPGTMAHEIGHNHGRDHAPCVPQGSSISGVDNAYPYSGGAISVWGYDKRSKMLVNPSNISDIMGYCNNKWISDYTYDGLLNRVASVNGAQRVKVDPALLARFRVLLLDAFGPRWGVRIDEPTLPAGVPEVAEILDASGHVVQHVVVYRTEVSEIDAWSILVPEPAPASFSLRVSGATPLAFDLPDAQP